MCYARRAQTFSWQVSSKIGAQLKHFNWDWKRDFYAISCCCSFFSLSRFESLPSLYGCSSDVDLLFEWFRLVASNHSTLCAFSVKHCYHCCNASKYTIMSKKTPWWFNYLLLFFKRTRYLIRFQCSRRQQSIHEQDK